MRDMTTRRFKNYHSLNEAMLRVFFFSLSFSSTIQRGTFYYELVIKWIILLNHSMKGERRSQRGKRRNGCVMSHEIKIKSRARVWLQLSRPVTLLCQCVWRMWPWVMHFLLKGRGAGGCTLSVKQALDRLFAPDSISKSTRALAYLLK